MFNKFFYIIVIFIIVLLFNLKIFGNISQKSLKCKGKKINSYELFQNKINKNKNKLIMLYNFTNIDNFNEFNYILKDLSNNGNDLSFNEIPTFNKDGIRLDKKIYGNSNPSNQIGILGSGPFTILWIGNPNKIAIR